MKKGRGIDSREDSEEMPMTLPRWRRSATERAGSGGARRAIQGGIVIAAGIARTVGDGRKANPAGLHGKEAHADGTLVR
jgi:hypothetical protein